MFSKSNFVNNYLYQEKGYFSPLQTFAAEDFENIWAKLTLSHLQTNFDATAADDF